jgi:hypothetical protein
MALLEDILSVEYRDLPPEQVEWLIEGTLGVPAEDLEDFWGSLKSVGGAVSKALPGIASGALTGATTGAALGPWGALGGALVGGTLGGVSHSSGQRPRQPTAPRVQPPSYAPTPPQAGFPAPPQVATSPAAAQLLQAMLRPEMLQALMAMLMGQAGRSSVPVGNTAVPVGAFANLLGVLANQAAAEYNAVVSARGEGLRPYEDFVETVGDPALAEDRAQALWELLKADIGEQGYAADPNGVGYSEYEEYYEEEESEESFYDELDLISLDSGYDP